MSAEGTNAHVEGPDNQAAQQEGIRVNQERFEAVYDRSVGTTVRKNVLLQVALEEAHEEIARLNRLLETARPEAATGPENPLSEQA